MKLRQFVSGSALVLGAWLAITFFQEVPARSYPKLDKHQRSAKAAAPSEAKAAETGAQLLQVSVSP
jgi:hypothetical protein